MAQRQRTRDWKVRRGLAAERPADGLVLQRRGTRGILDLSAWILAPPNNLSLLTPVVTSSVSEGIRKDTGLMTWLHWPNLVAAEGRALGRVSVSLSSGVVQIATVVNCFAAAGESISQPGLPSTSILDVLGTEIEIDLLRERIIDSIDWYVAEWERGVYGKLVARIQPNVRWLGEQVKVVTADGGVILGRAVRLDEEGFLLVKQAGRSRTHAFGPSDVERCAPCSLIAGAAHVKRTLLSGTSRRRDP